MKLAISILNRNWLKDTIECLDSILNSNFSDYKIFILDNGSKNKKEYNVLKEKYWNNKNIEINRSDENLWFTWGNNYNIKKILDKKDFEYIILLNNDCKLEKNFLSNFIKKIKETEKIWIFGPIIKWYDNSIQAIWSYINLWTGSSCRVKEISWKCQKVDYVTWSCMVIPKEILTKICVLDDRFFAYREESDYCLRAKREWYNTYAINIDWIYHKEESAQRKIKPYYTYLMFRNRILFLKKHANILQYLFSYFILLAYLVVIFPKNFWTKNYKYAIKGIVDGIKWLWWKPNM